MTDDIRIVLFVGLSDQRVATRDLDTVVKDAVSKYVSDVKSKDFPNEKEKY